MSNLDDYGDSDIPGRRFTNLALKYKNRIDSVPASRHVQLESSPTSWQVCRILRRDFNLVSQRLYHISINRDMSRRALVRDLLMGVVLQSEMLVGESNQFELTREIPVYAQVPIRLVCAEASVLYQTLMNVDRAMARLLCAVIDGHLSPERRQRCFVEFAGSFVALKNVVVSDGTTAKTAQELAQELKIE